MPGRYPRGMTATPSLTLSFPRRKGAVCIHPDQLSEVRFPVDGEWACVAQDGKASKVKVKDGRAVLPKPKASSKPSA